MWFGVLLICKVAVGDCMVVPGPMVRSEQACEQSIPHGISYVTVRHPDYTYVDYKCVAWGAEA